MARKHDDTEYEAIPLEEHTKEDRLEMAIRYLASELHRSSQVDEILGEHEAARARPIG